VVSQKQLGPNEQIVMSLHQHVKALFGPILIFLVTCAAVGFVANVIPDSGAQMWLRLAIALVGLVIVAKWSLWPFLNWLFSKYTVTTERILTEHGVFRRYGRTMPMSRVNDVSFDSGVIDRIFRCGTLVVSSAGEHGQLLLPDVPNVEKVQREIYGLVDAEQDRARSTVVRPLDSDDGTGYGPNV
jgi:membrane protein YdbS with pleckstrin-like domain